MQLEVGMFRGQAVPERICQLCKSDVESEIHFLFECPLYFCRQILQETDLTNVQSNREKMRRCMSTYQKTNGKVNITQIWNERQTLIAT